ncbi:MULTISPECIES: oxidoreductase-like domain-containing protein [unclassified Pseudoalteromonas]|uniref:oxidoreductase-like domain-containing protein n=1 Tax=unclassified Pseudoalteromonas TaxID=194690 RepID=UPI000B3C77D3|nr:MULTISPECIES: oxidoreductase-like domain-containing protein [unclassified Pseudoalteromonas]MDN3379838.1 oxidoreductase-like domain-containing protein [Pseudoalteromonas sp. APC 3893]MDN3388178.1 oxidoreductase-like domain-containing protein [Pseudoalteromonas sp. APC 4017]OUS73617.1 oxidoreductase [Pseudoalteromonas sp. A601]
MKIDNNIIATTEQKDKPQRPASDECCGGGSCCPCVWDEYREALKTWRENNPLPLTDKL